MTYSDEDIQALLDGVYAGKINEYKLPVSLYKAITDYLRRALVKGAGDPDAFSTRDSELFAKLEQSVYMFGAAKTYQETKALSSLLVDEDGKLRSSSEFNRLGRDLFDLWNGDWGKSEYNTALAQATMAVKWDKIENEKNLFPNLRYSAVGGEETCEICGALDGMVAPADDPVWDTIYPPNHFNCMCTVLQEYDAEPTPDYRGVVDGVADKMQDTFKHNAAKTGELFSKDHPYYDVPAKDREYARRNFDLPIPTDDNEQ